MPTVLVCDAECEAIVAARDYGLCVPGTVAGAALDARADLGAFVRDGFVKLGVGLPQELRYKLLSKHKAFVEGAKRRGSLDPNGHYAQWNAAGADAAPLYLNSSLFVSID